LGPVSDPGGTGFVGEAEAGLGPVGLFWQAIAARTANAIITATARFLMITSVRYLQGKKNGFESPWTAY
jgi:hypothetical protein